MESDDDFEIVPPPAPRRSAIGRLQLNRDRFSAIINRNLSADGDHASTSTASGTTPRQTFAERFSQFRTQANTASKTPGRRTGRPTSHFRSRIICLDGPDVTRVTGFRVCNLTRVGLGNSGRSHDLPLSMSSAELDLYIRNLFPAVGTLDFKLARVTRTEIEILPSDVMTPKDLKQWGKLKSSALYIVPCSQIVIPVAPTPQQDPHHDDETVAPTPQQDPHHDDETVAPAPQQDPLHDDETVAPTPQQDPHHDDETVAPTPQQDPHHDDETVAPTPQQDPHHDDETLATALHDSLQDMVEVSDGRAIETPPIANRRTCRTAAATARVRVRGWVQNRSRTRPAASMPAPGPSSEELFLPTSVMSEDDFRSELDGLYYNDDEAVIQEPTSSDTLPQALKDLAAICLGDRDSGLFKLVVRRRSCLTDALENLNRAQTRLLQPLHVRFIGESALDDGGPSRELSSEMIKQFDKSNFVEGESCNKVFRHDFSLLSKDKYRHLGQLTALLLLQGGQGLPVFCDTVTKYILSGQISSAAQDLPESVKSALQELENMSDNEIKRSIDDLLPDRFDQGYCVPSSTLDKGCLGELTQAMVAHYLIRPQKMALDQFVQGLQIGGVLDTLQRHVQEAGSLFKGAAAVLTMDRFESCLKFHYENLMAGSNNLVIAEAIEQGIIVLLQGAESGEASFLFNERVSISLGDILMWMTGATNIPAIGFPKEIDIFFDPRTILPKVNTCSLEVYFPLLRDLTTSDRIMHQLAEWILDSQGFGQV